MQKKREGRLPFPRSFIKGGADAPPFGFFYSERMLSTGRFFAIE